MLWDKGLELLTQLKSKKVNKQASWEVSKKADKQVRKRVSMQGIK